MGQGLFLLKSMPIIRNTWILQRLIIQANNHKMNDLRNLQTISVNK